MASVDRGEIENLLYREARLLDERRYQEWLNLYTPDATYWIPSWRSEATTVDKVDHDLSLVYLDRAGLEDYVTRWQSGHAHVVEPPPRVSRLLSNLLVEADDAAEPRVLCKWLMQLYRNDVQEIFSGDCEYRLRAEDGRYRISFKKVVVLNDLMRRGHLLLV